MSPHQKSLPLAESDRPARRSLGEGGSDSRATGPQYWRGLEELQDTPEFRQWLEREFPAGASEWTDPVSRRHFMRLMSASFMLAGVGLAGSGCRRPEEKIEPFGQMPENYVHGVPQYYATAMPTQSSAIPLVVKSNDGRPTKIEANDKLDPEHHVGTDRFAQASILNLYDPDRAARFTHGGQTTTREAAMDFLADLSKTAKANGGQGLAFLMERNSSPSRRRLQEAISKSLPSAKWFIHDPIDLDIHRRAATKAFGKSVRPQYLFDRADVVVSLDCDFIGSEEDAYLHIGRFARRRKLEKPQDTINRLYVVEGLMTLTGFNADHRLRAPTSTVASAAGVLAGQILRVAGQVSGLNVLNKVEGAVKWVEQCAADLLSVGHGKSLVVAGYRQPIEVHILAFAINAALGNIGKTLLLAETPESNEGTDADLLQFLKQTPPETLVILGANPAYSTSRDFSWPRKGARPRTVIRLGYYEDETFPLSDWHLPLAHYLESWGDAQTSDGVLVPVQPLIGPLFGGMTELELLARLGGLNTSDAYAIVRETFTSFNPAGNPEEAWKKFLHDGFLGGSTVKHIEVELDQGAVAEARSAATPAPPDRDRLEVVFHRDYKVDDGRYNNNGWLQELPDPVTKLVWDNAVLMSRKTAHELGLKNSDVVEISHRGCSVRGPVWVQPGFADYSLGLALGYGRTRTGRVGKATGFNAYELRTGPESFAVGATLRKTGDTYKLTSTQTHWSMEGRPIVREANLDQYRKNPEFLKELGEEKLPGDNAPLYPNPFDDDKGFDLKQHGLHQWGMAIDLNKCVGCSACILACQSENNVPIVGKEQVGRGREMHWLRIDRYYAGRLAPKNSPEAKEEFFEPFAFETQQQFEKWIDDPQVVMQPMLCQHCEAAPCENVCPVNATSHDAEGLNVMTYNRCVGTRYCSNNCPYKVRRFNFFDYNKRPIGKLYLGPFGHRPDDEWDLIKMIKNPDVTVRMRGVMEKCTYCIQRIEQAKIAQKRKAGASSDVIVPTDSFTTACAQACPADAIVFGDLKKPESRVSRLKLLDRNYKVLPFLLTRPRTTYLARIRNPNPAMPDYSKHGPLSLQEFEQRNGETVEGESQGRTEAK